jgi:hypothetical protein
VREPYRGGKSDGRAHKGRRRGGATRSEGEGGGGGGGGKKDDDDVVRIAAAAPTAATILEPFPTLYWLTSPALRAHVSRIEASPSRGASAAEGWLRASRECGRAMERAHASYGASRWALLTEEDRDGAAGRGWRTALDGTRGVAGIASRGRGPPPSAGDDDEGGEGEGGEDEGGEDEDGDGGTGGYRDSGVKCLHAHVAHYLAQVSEWEEEEEEARGRRGPPPDAVGSSSASASASAAAWSHPEGCARDDLNLVGRWTMEAVMESLRGGIGPL